MNIFSRMQPNTNFTQSSKERRAYDKELEGLRGFAAFSVGYAHVFGFKNLLDPNYHPNGYWAYLQAAHGAVLIFFVLSGYVIGLTNTAEFSIQRAIQYLIRRGMRLLPIYFIAVGFSVIVQPVDTLVDTLGNLGCLQALFVPTIKSNPVLWTLNYEVFYYLSFILVWWLKPNQTKLLLGLFLTSAIGWFIPQIPQIISSYASGFIFWLMGLWLSWKVLPRASNYTQVPLLSYLLLLHATNQLATGVVILNRISPNSVAGPVNLSTFAMMPICILIVATITKRHLSGLYWLRIISFFIPVINIILLLFIGRLFENPAWITSAISTVLATMWGLKTKVNILAILAPFGRISYAFYVLHMPMMHLVRDYFPVQGTVWSFSLRLLVWFLMTVAASSLLELVMQPAIKRWFHQKLVLKGA